MKDYSSMTVQERIEDMFAYLAVCRQMESMLPERIEILEMGLRALEEKIGNNHKEENVMTITAKVESMKRIPKTCMECDMQILRCVLLSDEHQSCPVTFHKELIEGATEKTEDGTTVINVLKTGRRCLCPLEEKHDEG